MPADSDEGARIDRALSAHRSDLMAPRMVWSHRSILVTEADNNPISIGIPSDVCPGSYREQRQPHHLGRRPSGLLGIRRCARPLRSSASVALSGCIPSDVIVMPPILTARKATVYCTQDARMAEHMGNVGSICGQPRPVKRRADQRPCDDSRQRLWQRLGCRTPRHIRCAGSGPGAQAIPA